MKKQLILSGLFLLLILSSGSLFAQAVPTGTTATTTVTVTTVPVSSTVTVVPVSSSYVPARPLTTSELTIRYNALLSVLSQLLGILAQTISFAAQH